MALFETPVGYEAMPVQGRTIRIQLALKYITLVCIALLTAATTAILSQTPSDTVQLSCAAAMCPAGAENGVLLVAKTTQREIEPSSQLSFSVGPVNPAYTQVLAFREDRAPSIQTGVAWTPHPKTVTLTYPELAEVPLQIWVLCLDPACGAVTENMRRALETFRANANDLLTTERAGMRISQAGGAANWISDETQNPSLTEFRDFVNDQCSALNRVVSMIGKKKPDAVNMYLVRTVDNEPTSGYRCPVENLAVDGWATFWTTKLHELGHTMSLRDAGIGKQPQNNVMFSMPQQPATRQYFTEGQVFRMHFTVDSSLNTIFSRRDPSLLRDCGRTNADAGSAVPPCPPLSTLIWPED